MSNPIVLENQNTGSAGWQVGVIAGTEIQAYADRRSLNPGQTINFCVSVQNAGAAYTIYIYRLGWYGGLGGRLIATISQASGSAQGYWNQSTLAFVGMNPSIDSTTHLFEAGWAITDSWTVPANACTGIYIAKIVDTTSGKEMRVVFTVLGNTYADYVYVRNDTTDAAYNDWGGYSLYSTPVALKVSLNRPDRLHANTGQLYYLEIPAIHWLESQGYNLSYISGIDIHATSNILLTHQAVLYPCHDEYWSLEMRNASEAARAAGLGLAFLGANACFWQIRFENDQAGHANRTITCYKVATANNNLSNDPFYGVDNTRVTTRWRDPLLNKPENALIGIMFKDTDTSNVAWTVDNSTSSKYLAGTGLVNGSSYGSDLVGYEFDQRWANGSEPNNLQVIGTSAVTATTGNSADLSHTTTYIGSGGALIFATGSISWTWALDPYRFDGTTPAVIPGMQALMAHVMTALIRPKSPTGFSAFSAHL